MFRITRESVIRHLKEIVLWIVVGAIILNLVSYLRQPEVTEKTLPGLTLETVGGKNIDLAIYRGKPLVIHFWATWCPTCKLETPNIDNLSKSYNVLTVAVNSGSDEDIRNFLSEKGVGFNVVNDRQGKFASMMHVEVFPSTFFYDASGNLAFIEVGYTTIAGLHARMKWLEEKGAER